MNDSKSIAPRSSEPDDLAKRMFTLVIVGLLAYVAAVIALMGFTD